MIKDILSIQYKGKEISEQSRKIILEHHYSKSYKTQKQVHVFELIMNEQVVGCAIFGQPMARTEDPSTLELRRLVTIPDLPDNSLSFFLGSCLRWIRKNDPNTKKIITFADPNQGHKGTIYKATNFIFEGVCKYATTIFKKGSRVIHQRQFYQKRNGDYTKNAKILQMEFKSGQIEKVYQKPKLKYSIGV